MIHKLTSGDQLRTTTNLDRDKVLLTSHNQSDYCRVSMTSREARRLSGRLVELAAELEENKEPDTILCCMHITSLLTLGTNYKVERWVFHERGKDPIVVCDDGVSRLMSSAFFHD